MSSFRLSRRPVVAAIASAFIPSLRGAHAATTGMQSWKLATPRRTGIHDVAPAPDGGVWFTAQASGHLGWFDPASGRTELVALGSRLRAAWRDPGTGPRGLDHRRRAERDRARRLAATRGDACSRCPRARLTPT